MEELAQFNLLAAYPERTAAESVLEELHVAGVPHSELSLVTREEDAELSADGSPGDDVEDTAKRAATGVAAGGAMGGTIGAIAGIATVGLPGIGMAIGAGALFAAAAGGVLSTQSTDDPEAWKQRVGPILGLVSEGFVVLGVHTDDEARADSAEGLLRDSRPHRVERVDTSVEPYG